MIGTALESSGETLPGKRSSTGAPYRKYDIMFSGSRLYGERRKAAFSQVARRYLIKTASVNKTNEYNFNGPIKHQM